MGTENEEIGKKNEKLKTKIDGIIFIVFRYCHCCGIIIVYLYYICLKTLFIFVNQMNVLMSLRLGMLLIQHCVLIKPSRIK